MSCSPACHGFLKRIKKELPSTKITSNAPENQWLHFLLERPMCRRCVSFREGKCSHTIFDSASMYIFLPQIPFNPCHPPTKKNTHYNKKGKYLGVWSLQPSPKKMQIPRPNPQMRHGMGILTYISPCSCGHVS